MLPLAQGGILSLVASQRFHAEPAAPSVRVSCASGAALPTPRATGGSESTERPNKRLRSSMDVYNPATQTPPHATPFQATPFQALQRLRVTKHAALARPKSGSGIGGPTTVERLNRVSPFTTIQKLVLSPPVPSPGWRMTSAQDSSEPHRLLHHVFYANADSSDPCSSQTAQGLKSDPFQWSSTLETDVSPTFGATTGPQPQQSIRAAQTLGQIQEVDRGDELLHPQHEHPSAFDRYHGSGHPPHIGLDQDFPQSSGRDVEPPRQQDEADGCLDETYSVDLSDEEAMANLLDPEVEIAKVLPPSSIIDGMDKDSKADEVFDANLQRSSPGSTPANCLLADDGGEDLLDYELDWDEVFEMAGHGQLVADPSSSISFEPRPDIPNRPGNPSQTQRSFIQGNRQSSGTVAPSGDLSRMPASNTPAVSPFARSPFPRKVGDKSPVTGLSNSTVLRTCFRIGELLNENTRCAKSNQDAVFELYARVTYSGRDRLAKTQDFQFVDLFKDQLPYLTGKLHGYRPDSLVAQQAEAFLGDAGKMKPCRCVCVLKRDNRAGTRWVAAILSIREVEWTEVDQARRLVTKE